VDKVCGAAGYRRGIEGMRRLVLAVAAGALCVLLASAAVLPGDARASAEDITETLGDCQDDEIENDSRVDICSRLADDTSLPEDLRAEALLNRGIVYLDEKQPERALEDFDKAIAFNPEYPTAHAYRGEANKALDRLEQALVDYNTAVALDKGQSADFLAFRGQVHRRMGSFDKAKADYESALKLETGHEIAVAGMRALGIKTPE
jgi:tetratricopeptide (TPR) repeat protein